MSKLYLDVVLDYTQASKLGGGLAICLMTISQSLDA